LNIHGANDIRQVEMHTDEPLISEPSTFEFKIATDKFRRYKSPDIHEIQAELTYAGGGYCPTF
jgi:hypothetical protein